MNFSIDYDKLGEIGSYLSIKGEELDRIYGELLDICASIENNWKSEDSSVYMYKMISFIKKLVDENEQIVGTSELLTRLSNKYNEKDVEWEKNIIREDRNKNE